MEEKFIDAPIQLVVIRDDGVFEITVEGINFMSLLKNKKIAILTVTGPSGTGKSFLSNLFMDKTTGFKLNSPNSPSPTKGLWIWGKPAILPDGTHMLSIDSEGVNSNGAEREKAIDIKIFILQVLMSTMLIYNSKSGLNENSIEELATISDLKKRINVVKIDKEGTINTRSTTMDVKTLNDYIPHFVWVFRDFQNEKSTNLREQVEQFLVETTDPKKNELREIIKSNFKKRDFYALGTAMQDENKLKNLESEPISHLRSEFLLQFEALSSFVKKSIVPKQIGNFFLDGKDLFGLIQNYIEYLNNDENPVIMSALENVLLSKAKKKSEKFLEVFKKQVSLIIKQFSEPISSKLPIETNEIYRDFYQISDDILQKFSESLNDNLTSKQLGDRILILMNKMRDELENILETNTNYFDELYQDAYDEIVRAIDNKTITKIEDLNGFLLGFISDWQIKMEKFFEFTKGDNKSSYVMKILITNIFSRIKQLGTEVLEIYSNISKESNNQIENLKINLKKNDELLIQERKKNEELTKEKSELFAKNIDLESKLGRMERDLRNNKKELDEMLKIEEQKLQNIRNTNDTAILEKERIISQLEKKLDQYEKQLSDVNKEFSAKLIESEKEVTKLLVDIERYKQNRPNSLKSSDTKDNKLHTLKTVFDSIQNIFGELKESIDKLDRDKEKMFKSKFLEFSTRELDNKSKFWLDELKQFKAEQIKLITEEYEKSIAKLKDELETAQSQLMQIQIKIEEEIQARENFRIKYEDALKEASNYQQISSTKESIIGKQKEMLEFNEEKILSLQKVKEDLEIKLSHSIINYKMREDELETLQIVMEGVLMKKKDKYDHNIKKLSFEVRKNIEEIVKNLKIFK